MKKLKELDKLLIAVGGATEYIYTNTPPIWRHQIILIVMLFIVWSIAITQLSIPLAIIALILTQSLHHYSEKVASKNTEDYYESMGNSAVISALLLIAFVLT